MVSYLKASYILTRKQLLSASELKLKITNSKQYDMFKIIATAFGNKISEGEKARRELPKAGFNTFEAFLSGGR